MMRILISLLVVVSAPVWAQMVEVTDPPAANGKEKAGEYFQDRKKAAPTRVAETESTPDYGGAAPRYLALHIGTYFSGDGYGWGEGDQSNIGKLNFGVDYRLGEWVNSADFALRIDYTNFQLEEGHARKISIGGIITFPDANSRFPLYFGGGLGAGLFLKQIHNESAVSLDYSLIAGARFLNVIDQLGFLVETGIKNHLHLFSSGQFNGIYINVGTVFMF